MHSRALIFLSIASSFCFGMVHSVTFTFRNNCPYTVWPATLTGSGPQVSSTGFQLPVQAISSLEIPPSWSGRIWARSFCTFNNAGRFVCETADCASGQVGCNGAGAIPPASLAEFTLGRFGNQDFYDVSHVDGFNLPLSITPQGGSGGCARTGCFVDVNANCPPELAVRNRDGAIIGCKSACLAFNQPQYCCTGAFGSPQTCRPTNYSLYFKNKCPLAYSYAFDDKSSTFTCTRPNGYLITICP